jgi:hypothetical protein
MATASGRQHTEAVSEVGDSGVNIASGEDKMINHNAHDTAG